MALVKKYFAVNKDDVRVHEGVECGYTVFDSSGQRYLQLDTYGSADRAIPGKVSQSLQFDYASASELRHLIDRFFPENRA